MTFSEEEYKYFSEQWNDARYRLSGGRYGEKMEATDREKLEKRKLILRFLLRYQALCKGAQSQGNEMRAATLSKQIETLEKIAKDYE